MDDIREIWSFPEGGAVLDLSARLEAPDLTAMMAVPDGVANAVLLATEQQRDTALAAARDVAADLKTKGIHMDVDRMMRGSLLERAQIWWDDVVDRWHHRGEPEDAPVPEDALFVFDLPVALTYPAYTLNAEYDAIDAEVARVTDALALQITVSRGREPLRVSVPDDLVDDLSEADDWSDDEDTLIRSADIIAYWPPVEGAPAVALSVVQEDGGHVIEVNLLAHGAAAHRRFGALLAAHGGRLE